MNKRRAFVIGSGILPLLLFAQTTVRRPTPAPQPQKSTTATTQRAKTGAQAAYDYEIVFDSAKPIGGKKIDSVLSVQANDAGEIVFSAYFHQPDKPKVQFGIFTKDRLITLDKLPNGAVAETLSNPRINNKGQIAYAATYKDATTTGAAVIMGYFVDGKLVLARRSEFGEGFEDFEFFTHANEMEGFPPELVDILFPFSLTPDGQILLQRDDASYKIVFPPLPPVDGPVLSLNGVPLFPPPGVMKLPGGSSTRAAAYPIPAASPSGEVIFTDVTTGLYSNRRGHIADTWPDTSSTGGEERLFVNSQGEVGYLQGTDAEVEYINADKVRDIHSKVATLFGFNDRREFLVKVYRSKDPQLEVNDVVVARAGRFYNDGRSPQPGILPLPGVHEDVHFPSASLNNKGEVVFGVNEYIDRHFDGSGDKPGKAFIVRARPKAQPQNCEGIQLALLNTGGVTNDASPKMYRDCSNCTGPSASGDIKKEIEEVFRRAGKNENVKVVEQASAITNIIKVLGEVSIVLALSSDTDRFADTQDALVVKQKDAEKAAELAKVLAMVADANRQYRLCVVNPRVTFSIDFSNAKPPGKCTVEQHAELQRKIKLACGVQQFSCNTQNRPNWESNRAKFLDCISAREMLMKTCFSDGKGGGGDQTHRELLEPYRVGLQRCEDFISGKLRGQK